MLRTVGPLKMNNQPPKVLFETVGETGGGQRTVRFAVHGAAPASSTSI